MSNKIILDKLNIWQKIRKPYQLLLILILFWSLVFFINLTGHLTGGWH